ncbi:MAG: sugar-binding protein [Flavobacteriaceae bacterium]|nr:MAG: sugar-binding protein [Flavobacteriaceae bacterium]
MKLCLKILFSLFFTISFGQKKEHQLHKVNKTIDKITIDGISDEKTWDKSSWLLIDQFWLGKEVNSSDFSGRYKLSWSKEVLYILVEIVDDVLLDQYDDPLKLWWDDDCIEIFIDEDNSGGEHQYNHNAFAYHVALDGNVVDLDALDTPKLFNNHVQSKRQTIGKISTWEFKISLFPDTYTFGGSQEPIPLIAGKKIGFAIAYCDNDYSSERENFIGSVFINGKDKNRGWIDASVFGTILLKE